MFSLEKRLINLYRIFIIIFLIIILRTFWIQLVKGPEYKEKAESQRYYEISTSYNGTIYDRNMIPLTNRESQKYLYIPRYNLISDENYYNELLEKIDYSEEKLKKYMEIEKDRIIKVPIKENIDDVNIKNTFVLEELKEYNDENILAHVIGYINENGDGIGIKKAYNEILSKGENNKLLLTFDGKNRILYDKENYIQANKNKDNIRNSIQLTIDYEIQKIVESAMESRQYYGSAIVTDVESGDILALTSQPDFDLNDIASSNRSNDNAQMNRSIKFRYYPASIFKTIVLLSALENDIDLDEKMICEGSIEVNNQEYSCHDDIVHGEITLKEAYAESCNTIFIQLAEKLGGEKIIETAKNIGLDDIVDIGLDGEVTGIISSLNEVRGAGIGNLAIGQEHIRLTPIQINNMTMIIANDGIRKDLSIIKGYATNKGKESKKFNRKEDKWLINSKYTQIIKKYMEEVVKNGTGSEYIGGNIYGGAAGKTGTAEKENGSNDGLFTGYFPINNPKYAITIVVEDIGDKSGASTAGVVFNEILEEINKLK